MDLNESKKETTKKPPICTADELHYVDVLWSHWRVALWRYRPPPEALVRNHPLMLASRVGTIGFDQVQAKRNWLDDQSPMKGKSAPWKHTLEGPDDMPAHIKSSMFGCSLTIPITDGRLNMGTWQVPDVA
ncbi:hypothetical protein QJS10_CPB19g00905 [Acorus calamus]|uniref:Uncharacterized protein n=1 Tax=Acorus calamus TaxID=4465 RepID=A0AAV9CF45_ACOCL|nr:hypothetical protein QJS10_CPB19g00905 [Acorus calamus]